MRDYLGLILLLALLLASLLALLWLRSDRDAGRCGVAGVEATCRPEVNR